MTASGGRRVFTDYADEAWQVSAFRLALLALLAGSVAAGPAVLRTALVGGWTSYLIPVAVIVAGAGVATTTLLGRPNWRDRRGAAFRLGELLLLLIGARVIVWAFTEGFPNAATLWSWVLNPGLFFTGEYLFAVFVWLCVWLIALVDTSDFLDLAIQPDEIAARQSHDWGDSRSQWRVGKPISRGEILQGFAYRWIGVGILLITCAGLTRIEVAVSQRGTVQVGLRGLGLQAEVVVCLVCYFLAGLLLLSDGRLAVLRGRWYNQEVEIGASLIRRWHLYALAFVGLLALLALLLPLGSTGWFIGIVEWVIALLIRFVLFVGFLLGLVVSLIGGLLARLFGVTQAPPDEATPPPPPTDIPTQAEATANLPPWLGGAVLWLIVALVAGILLINFLRTSGLLTTRFGMRAFGWRLWWRARRARMAVAVSTRLAAVRRRLRRARRRAERPRVPDVGSHGPLLPRDQVRRYYLAAVKEAGEEGAPRSPHETPLEYAEELAARWPESVGDTRELTDAFLDARYSAHEIGAPEVVGAENAWRRFVRGLRGDRRSRK